ncbi:MAG: zinc ribbon domain-containing protein [Phormidesmis sp.]
MPACPQCNRPISSDAISCPHCHVPLKAHGHPGMQLYRAGEDGFLCPTCVYDADGSCNFPKRPEAKSCTLYQKIGASQALTPQEIYRVPWWRKVNRFWLGIAILLGISVLVSFL